jgi:hypothetical protein
MAKVSKATINRVRQVRRTGTPGLFTWVGSPEIPRLKAIGQLAPLAMGSNREAMIGDELFAALDGETTTAFHKRMLGVAKEKGEPWVYLGDPSNIEPPKSAAPYPARSPDTITH